MSWSRISAAACSTGPGWATRRSRPSIRRSSFAAISSQGDTGPERLNVSFGSTLDATSGIAALTGYEDEEPRISGMDVNYPDQIVSLFATGIVITAIMEARRSGRGAFLDFSQREVASFTLGEEIMAAAADPQRAPRRRGNHQDGVAQQDTYRCRDGRWIAVTLSVPDAEIAAFCAGCDSGKAVATLQARGVAAAACNDGIALLNDRALAGVALARDASAAWSRACPTGSTARGCASRGRRRISASTPTRCCANCWDWTMPSLPGLPNRA